MNNLSEIKDQSKFSCFVKMYGYIAEEILKAGGNLGERAVREAVSRYGSELGEEYLQRHLEEGRPTNLQMLLKERSCCGEDPRFIRKILKSTEEVQLLEVYSCPMEKEWRKSGCLRAGAMYCEEYIHAVMKGYTEGKGQANLSNLLTCSRDSFCRFSLYLRPANMDETQRKHFWGSESPEKAKWDNPDWEMAAYGTEYQFVKLYMALARSAREFLDMDGVSAVISGLKKLEQDMVSFLLLESDHTGEPMDAAFINSYFPLGVFGGASEVCDESFMEHMGENREENLDDLLELLKLHLIDPMKKTLLYK